MWRPLDSARGKRRAVVAVAVARQLAEFCWFDLGPEVVTL